MCTVGVDGPRRHRCARMRSCRSQTKGAVRERSYPHWYGHVQECFCVAWGECGRAADFAQETTAAAGCGVSGEVATDADWYRSLRCGALLGARADRLGA